MILKLVSLFYFSLQLFIMFGTISLLDSYYHDFFCSVFKFDPNKLISWYLYIPGYILYYLIVVFTFIIVFFLISFIIQAFLYPVNIFFVKYCYKVLKVDFKKFKNIEERFTFFEEVKMELKKYLLYFVLFIIPLPFLLLPALGGAFYYFISLFISAYILTYEYFDYSFILFKDSRTLSERMKSVFDRYFIWLSFGSGVYFLIALPIINLFFTPVILAGSSLLFYEKFYCQES